MMEVGRAIPSSMYDQSTKIDDPHGRCSDPDTSPADSPRTCAGLR